MTVANAANRIRRNGWALEVDGKGWRATKAGLPITIVDWDDLCRFAREECGPEIVLKPGVNLDGWPSRVKDHAAILDLLKELFEYMDARADCDADQSGFKSNQEMKFSEALRELLIANGRRP